ncbi:MAG: UPF0175 family protein [bacterium]
MDFTIPFDIFQSARITEEELKQEMALLLFKKEKLTLGQASQLAGITQLQFQHLLASQQIPIHYGAEDFEEDLKTLKEIG